MAADQKIELELALRDSVSVALRTISSNLEQVNTKLTRGGEEIRQGTDTLSKVAKNTRDIGESARTASRHLVGLGDTLIKVSSLLTTGPVAIGAGMVAATAAIGRQLKGVSDERLRLKAMSEDSGLSEKQISVMMRTQARQGLNPEQATRNIETLTGKLKAMSTDKTGSELFRGLADIGMARYGKALMDSVGSGGDVSKATALIFDQYEEIRRTHGAEAATAYAQVLELNESFLQTYKARSAGVQPAFIMNLEAAKSWADRWAIVHENLAMMWDVTIGSMIWALVRADEWAEKASKSPMATPMAPTGSEGVVTPEVMVQPPSGSRDEEELKASKKDSSKMLDDIGGILDRMWEKTKGLVGKQEGGPILPGREYQVGEAGPEVFNAGGEYSLVGEGGPERFSSKTPGFMEKLREKSEAMTGGQLGVGLAMKKLAPGPIGWIPSIIAADEDKSWRDWARSKLGGVFGYDPEVGSPNPWEAGGSWNDPTTKTAQRLEGEGEAEDQLKGIWDLSGKIAPGGIGWEQWRRSENVEGVDDPTVHQEVQAGIKKEMDESLPQTFARWSEENQSATKVGPISYEAGLGELERMLMDQSAGMAGKRGMAAEIEFKNVPPGVETQADGEGFDDFNVNKTKQLENAY